MSRKFRAVSAGKLNPLEGCETPQKKIGAAPAAPAGQNGAVPARATVPVTYSLRTLCGALRMKRRGVIRQLKRTFGKEWREHTYMTKSGQLTVPETECLQIWQGIADMGLPAAEEGMTTFRAVRRTGHPRYLHAERLSDGSMHVVKVYNAYNYDNGDVFDCAAQEPYSCDSYAENLSWLAER